ncbi:hypothetical protein GALMADRAFT_148979 [Galerina marginata CBS 339.88]|uniref:Uncharacterized protein n=1 Tax=Galerina marginata (strain CBS 339.88) TaxID=685588 RepID=A0A067S5F3_GALM3|nr:hypothetical protein GALMADRAFT_148979 [Galerina marginata CBS 339.88]
MTKNPEFLRPALPRPDQQRLQSWPETNYAKGRQTASRAPRFKHGEREERLPPTSRIHRRHSSSPTKPPRRRRTCTAGRGAYASPLCLTRPHSRRIASTIEPRPRTHPLPPHRNSSRFRTSIQAAELPASNTRAREFRWLLASPHPSDVTLTAALWTQALVITPNARPLSTHASPQHDYDRQRDEDEGSTAQVDVVSNSESDERGGSGDHAAAAALRALANSDVRTTTAAGRRRQ